ncbi:LOW QUALITY PROTEIN: NACHT, LRR and PYD domains-containing protein 3 [Cololabis saira]|uniref:LOW QUALITY PROTEIN: NACHT, LRR and PYD domains-containing protein 3 n=1 Tax=Cololabis saira TaxID=129043 RepID=UPI002AD35433|nr:LOW QUALITY PROTEIN: NACHT, LRR and PYD domains-containing protein 3 [Cololabis saira]
MEDQEMSDDSSIGEAVSGRGEPVSEEDENLFYIPERRASLDLGQSTMDTSNWTFVEQALTPAQSYGSMSSGEDKMADEVESDTRVHLGRVGSFSSCYSVDSNDCEKKTLKDKGEEDVSAPPDVPQFDLDLHAVGHPSLTISFTFQAISGTLGKLSPGELDAFKRMLWLRFPQWFTAAPQSVDRVDLVDRLLECFSLEASVTMTKALLIEMDKNRVAEFLETMCIRNEVRYELSEVLRKEYSEICESSPARGEKRAFDEIYTDLFISSISDNGPNIEHEIIKVEKLNTNQKAGARIPTQNVFHSEDKMNVKLLLLSGSAGSGKSMTVQKVILDWTEGRSYTKFNLLIPLPLRRLKPFESRPKLSLVDIITELYPVTTKLKPGDFRGEDCELMFVMDGMDEYSEELDFWNTELLSDPEHHTTLPVILVNMLRGRLVYPAHILVTSRPRLNPCIPWDTMHDHGDILGFSDPEKEEYFQKRFKDGGQAARAIEFIKSCKTLHIMCHLPLFCSLVGDECQRVFTEQAAGATLPRGITYMYTKLLLELLRRRRPLGGPVFSPEEEREFLLKWGKLAWTLLEKGEFKMNRIEWTEQETTDVEAVLKTGLCVQYITTPFLFHTEKVLSFLHPTMQEYLAALYVYLSFACTEINVLGPKDIKAKFKVLKGKKILDLYKCAVDRSQQCEDGRLDVFLRFLCGLTHRANQELLQPLCSSVKLGNVADEAAALIRKRIKDRRHPDRNSNLQRCLEELGV